jgi:hypothetical protein
MQPSQRPFAARPPLDKGRWWTIYKAQIPANLSPALEQSIGPLKTTVQPFVQQNRACDFEVFYDLSGCIGDGLGRREITGRWYPGQEVQIPRSIGNFQHRFVPLPATPAIPDAASTFNR